MTKTKYGVITPKKPEFTPRDLLVVPHRRKPLVLSKFGPDTYSDNISEMEDTFSCQPHYERMNFTPATTSQSISGAAHNFGDIAKPAIFDESWLQLGYIVITQEGVFANTHEKPGNLKSLLGSFRKVNGIWLGDNDSGFAPYDTFKIGVQESGEFAEGGLARLLEHSRGRKATKLSRISDPRFYKLGVNVFGFNIVNKEPGLRIASLYSDRSVDRLDLDGEWGDDDGGFAFGVKR